MKRWAWSEKRFFGGMDGWRVRFPNLSLMFQASLSCYGTGTGKKFSQAVTRNDFFELMEVDSLISSDIHIFKSVL